MNTNVDNDKLLEFALNAGKIMLSNGAETIRVEDTMVRILSTSQAYNIEVVSASTFLIGSITNHKQESKTLLKRVKSTTVNFEKICRINDISRNFVSGKISLETAEQELIKADNIPEFSYLIKTLGYGFACLGFTLVLSGTFIDAILSFIFGIFLGILQQYSDEKELPYFFMYLLGGTFAGFGATLLSSFLPTPDLVIIGTITPLLPGRMMTNSIRDLLEGNFISGGTKLMEALLTAFSLAGGVGFGVNVGNNFLNYFLGNI